MIISIKSASRLHTPSSVDVPVALKSTTLKTNAFLQWQQFVNISHKWYIF